MKVCWRPYQVLLRLHLRLWDSVTGGYRQRLLQDLWQKESVVSTLSVLFGTTDTLAALLTPVSAASLLVFCLLYTPCVAAIASIKRELGGKWAALVVIMQCAIAWTAAFAVALIGMLLGL